MGGPDPLRPERVSFNKRNGTVFRKAHELATLCGANVYVFVDHPRARTAYCSVENAHWPPPDEFLEDRHPDLQRLHTSTMGQAHSHQRKLKSSARPKRRMRAAGSDRDQVVTQNKVSRKTGRPRKTRQRRQHIDSESETMAWRPLSARSDSKRHSESGYSGISQPMDISQSCETCRPPSQRAREGKKQTDDNMEGIFEPDHPRIPVAELLNG